jgi:hypothetical protein
MKPALFLSAPLLAFFAALLAGLVPPHDPAASPVHSKSAPADIEPVLAEMERRVVRFHSAQSEVCDADGLEIRLLNDLQNSQSGDGLEALNYSRRWASANPAEMFEWFIRQELVPSKQRKSYVAWLFSEWAKQDMNAALAAMPRMKQAESRAQALVSTLEKLCEKDPVRARELLLQNVDSLEVLKSVEFYEFEPGQARTDLVLALPPGRLRSMLMAENIRCLMYRGIGCGGDNSSYYAKAAIGTRLWKQLSNEERRGLVDAGLRLSEFDEIQLDGLEDLIKQHAESSSDPRQAWLFIDQYGVSWAKRDVGAAVSWAMAHLQGEERMEWGHILLTFAAEKDFDAAINVWRSLPEKTMREEAAKWLLLDVPADRTADKALLEEALPKPGKW